MFRVIPGKYARSQDTLVQVDESNDNKKIFIDVKRNGRTKMQWEFGWFKSVFDLCEECQTSSWSWSL